MPHRRILSLWFPRLGAERLIRRDPALGETPFAVAWDKGNMQVLSSLSCAAAQAGLTEGQPLRDAQAMCPSLVTRLRNTQAEAIFLTRLRRWAGKFSPWVAEEAPSGLVIDLTGCTHLFGGEEALLIQVAQECEDLGLTVQTGIADTPGAAWGLARYAGQPVAMTRSGDAIDQEAWATRSRAAKRRYWEKGGHAPRTRGGEARTGRIAQPGKTRAAISPLPVASLRVDTETVEALTRLGLRRVEDLIGQPRAGLARRFGQALVQRLDQALGAEPEPISPAKPPDSFATRLTFPEPIGLESDIAAGLNRLLPRLQELLQAKGRGARKVRLEWHRSDHTMGWADVGLARPSSNADRIRPLLLMKLGDIDAGFGIDCLRVEAVVTEPIYPHQHQGHAEASAKAEVRRSGEARIDDLIGRIGARIGLEAITRQHPADSHIPEKAVTTLAAAWSEPCHDWDPPHLPRPVLLWRPELVTSEDPPGVPTAFRWRRRDFRAVAATGPERIAPEWWLDEPEWRTGTRDYWRVTTESGERLWLYYAHGGAMTGGWFCQGAFV